MACRKAAQIEMKAVYRLGDVLIRPVKCVTTLSQPTAVCILLYVHISN